MKIACTENFSQLSSAELVEASFEIAQMIAQAKKPHNIGETLIKPCMLKASSLVLGESNSKKLAKISLSDSTIKTRIDELANDIECQVLQKIHASPYFAIQCDETTDVAQLSQLMVYARFVGSATIEEEMLFCKSENPDAVGTHCLVHREALASKTLPAAMKKKLAIITVYELLTLSNQVLSIPSYFPSYVNTRIPIMKICCFLQMFNGYQKVIC